MLFEGQENDSAFASLCFAVDEDLTPPDPKETSKMERAEIERRLEPFVTQLSAGPEHIQRTLLNLRVIENYRLSKPAYCRKISLY